TVGQTGGGWYGTLGKARGESAGGGAVCPRGSTPWRSNDRAISWIRPEVTQPPGSVLRRGCSEARVRFEVPPEQTECCSSVSTLAVNDGCEVQEFTSRIDDGVA